MTINEKQSMVFPPYYRRPFLNMENSSPYERHE